MKPVLVIWRDAASYPHWHRKGEIPMDLVKMQTLGWLLKRTKKVVVIAQTKFNGGVGDVQVIPNSWIVEIKKVKI